MPPQPTSVRFNEEDDDLLTKLAEKMATRSKSQAVRKSVAQAAFFQEIADEDGNLTVILSDGRQMVVPLSKLGG